MSLCFISLICKIRKQADHFIRTPVSRTLVGLEQGLENFFCKSPDSKFFFGIEGHAIQSLPHHAILRLQYKAAAENRTQMNVTVFQ